MQIVHIYFLINSSEIIAENCPWSGQMLFLQAW